MNYKIERKLRDFLDKKLKEIAEETANINPRFNKLHILNEYKIWLRVSKS